MTIFSSERGPVYTLGGAAEQQSDFDTKQRVLKENSVSRTILPERASQVDGEIWELFTVKSITDYEYSLQKR